MVVELRAIAFLDEAARRAVGVLGGHAVGRGADELVRVVKGEGGRDVIIGLRRARGARPTETGADDAHGRTVDRVYV